MKNKIIQKTKLVSVLLLPALSLLIFTTSSVFAASAGATKYCNGKYVIKAERSECAFGYDEAAKGHDYQASCKKKYGSSFNYVTCTAGAAGAPKHSSSGNSSKGSPPKKGSKPADKTGSNKDKSKGGKDTTNANATEGVDPAIKCDKNKCDLIKKYVNPTMNLLTVAFGLIAVISLIIGSINYTTSEGDPQKASKAKQRIFNTVVAVAAYMFLYGFLQFLIPGGVFNR
jgi:hypothetical protein